MDQEEREHLIRKLKRKEHKMKKENIDKTEIKKIHKARRRLEEIEEEGN